MAGKAEIVEKGGKAEKGGKSSGNFEVARIQNLPNTPRRCSVLSNYKTLYV
jgi:hypothetical protein